MKQIARNLDVSETWDGQTYQLRLMPQPIISYEDEDVVDGSIFVLAHGTNAELLAIVEARRGYAGDDGALENRIRATRCGSATRRLQEHANLECDLQRRIPQLFQCTGWHPRE